VYSLISVTDGLKNKVNLFPTTTRSKRDMTRIISVLKPAEFSFKGCRAGQTIKLLQGRKTELEVKVAKYDERDGPWNVGFVYVPPPAPTNTKSGSKGSLQGWARDVNGDQHNIKLQADAPGEYRIVGARGQVCAGDILSPEVCQVVEVPVPKAEIEWRMLHEWFVPCFVVMSCH
jgi:nucleoporin POM152